MPLSLNDANIAINYNNLLKIAQYYKGPFWAYDAQIIKSRISQLRNFDIIRFAQKANSNIHILRLMRSEGVKVDSVSLGEIERALIAGYQADNEDIVFTADIFDEMTLKRVVELKLQVNVGSIDMLTQLGLLSPGHSIWLRVNPGFGHGFNKKTNTGGENSKHGIWYNHLFLALSIIHKYKLRLFGIHIHIGSGTDYHHLKLVCNSMIRTVIELNQDLEAISAGGGLSIPYHFDDVKVNTEHYFNMWHKVKQCVSNYLGHTVKLEIEPGRFLVAESGVLVSQIRAIKNMGDKHFILVNAGFNDLIRPSMYGCYHHISLMTRDNRYIDSNKTTNSIVAGHLCESGDVFTQSEGYTLQTRTIPLAQVGDYLVFHDCGAYGASMSSNYNSRPLIPEVLFNNGKCMEIRRAQTIQDLISLELIYNEIAT
ncbi:diaminopimelate decarboxylase [Candidatus Pantoea edessiphila]|uniref:Diaminopimelate decarboxylase n=1 Tax=Candidatus Pantoea edessiphila TaxID=2044610 RepID=A0A2P5SXM4_9GAMM|nr:diaminopimelate decarboxylase [Candidatus Pantoea edessiphila]MBK4775695.1 diaminopimelate decarboxylase [Pantoea sp. Edef]PPI87074.1 diaminopimelate decarboxylase [Candidatus Pantoea edessiphila]